MILVSCILFDHALYLYKVMSGHKEIIKGHNFVNMKYSNGSCALHISLLYFIFLPLMIISRANTIFKLKMSKEHNVIYVRRIMVLNFCTFSNRALYLYIFRENISGSKTY